jgi:CheY-like chemotaxis protein
VFINLLVNAAQAIQPGHADRNTISVTARTDAAGWAVIEIEDTGSGMSHEVQKRIFEPFFTTKEVGAGTGLGLSICRGIVSSLGGRIELDSEPGRGTCVRVALPPGAPEEPSSLPVTELPKAALRGRILVIDDEPLVLKLLQRALQDHDVRSTDSARKALAWIQEGQTFDLIICDLMMPTMTGIAFYEALLQRAPALAARVVFVTGGAITAQVDGFLRSVENVRIQKPFAVEELITQVQALLNASRSTP